MITKQLTRTVLSFTFLLTAASVYGSNVEQSASEIADRIASKAPIKLSQNMTISHVIADGETVQLSVMMSYTKQRLIDQAERSDLGQNEMLQTVKERLHNSVSQVCKTDHTRLGEFLNLGGKLRYIYTFSDGNRFTEAEVDCA